MKIYTPIKKFHFLLVAIDYLFSLDQSQLFHKRCNIHVSTHTVISSFGI